jgi:molybdenum cofactor cytidylyltransferase
MNQFDTILLTAGKSSRMGQDKALLKINGRYVINIIIEKLINACVGRHRDLPVHAFNGERPIHELPVSIFIVLGHHGELIKSNVEEQFLDKVEFVYNENHLEGMFSSIKKGISSLSGENNFLLQMIDQPFIEQELYNKIIDEYDNNSPICQPIYINNGKKGHPIIINKKLIPLIKNDLTSNSLREFLTPYYKNMQLIEYDKSSILQNLNNYENFKETLTNY